MDSPALHSSFFLVHLNSVSPFSAIRHTSVREIFLTCTISSTPFLFNYFCKWLPITSNINGTFFLGHQMSVVIWSLGTCPAVSPMPPSSEMKLQPHRLLICPALATIHLTNSACTSLRPARRVNSYSSSYASS